jgi:hypothetical protein
MTNTKTLPPCKHELALFDLLCAGLTGISKLTELPSYGETSLPTTISELYLDRGFTIDRVRKPHVTRHKTNTFFTWYWLANTREAEKAIALVNAFRKARNAELISDDVAQKLIATFPAQRNTGEAA